METTAERFIARSASDKTEDWPFWFVADNSHGGLNVTLALIEKLFGQRPVCMPFLPRESAIALAEQAKADAH